jgi:hypothetical protein
MRKKRRCNSNVRLTFGTGISSYIQYTTDGVVKKKLSTSVQQSERERPVLIFSPTSATPYGVTILYRYGVLGMVKKW